MSFWGGYTRTDDSDNQDGYFLTQQRTMNQSSGKSYEIFLFVENFVYVAHAWQGQSGTPALFSVKALKDGTRLDGTRLETPALQLTEYT